VEPALYLSGKPGLRYFTERYIQTGSNIPKDTQGTLVSLPSMKKNKLKASYMGGNQTSIVPKRSRDTVISTALLLNVTGNSKQLATLLTKEHIGNA
jgi:hypothetical protein